VIHLGDISATGCFSIIDTQLALYRSIQNHGLEQVDKKWVLNKRKTFLIIYICTLSHDITCDKLNDGDILKVKPTNISL
jgi:hypothetical protein